MKKILFKIVLSLFVLVLLVVGFVFLDPYIAIFQANRAIKTCELKALELKGKKINKYDDFRYSEECKELKSWSEGDDGNVPKEVSNYNWLSDDVLVALDKKSSPIAKILCKIDEENCKYPEKIDGSNYLHVRYSNEDTNTQIIDVKQYKLNTKDIIIGEPAAAEADALAEEH